MTYDILKVRSGKNAFIGRDASIPQFRMPSCLHLQSWNFSDFHPDFQENFRWIHGNVYPTFTPNTSRSSYLYDLLCNLATVHRATVCGSRSHTHQTIRSTRLNNSIVPNTMDSQTESQTHGHITYETADNGHRCIICGLTIESSTDSSVSMSRKSGREMNGVLRKISYVFIENAIRAGVVIRLCESLVWTTRKVF